jgi:hypothetical protein
MEATARTQAVEKMIRKRTGVTAGTLPISKATVNFIVASGAARDLIGKPRAARVWGAIADLVLKHDHKLVDGTRRAHRWATNEELHLMANKAAATARGSAETSVRAAAAEITGGISAWIRENEEQIAGTDTWKLRPGKLNQLKGARKNLTKRRGGPQAITAAIVRLVAKGTVITTETPNLTHKRGKDVGWIHTATEWMVAAGWETEQEAEAIALAAESHLRRHPTLTLQKETLVLNLGEGWGSVREGLESLRDNIRVVGADRRGNTYTGYKKGIITSELMQDWNNTSTDLLTALSKKASVSILKWNLITLEPECTVFSQGNSMNQKKGSAHGKRATTEQNRAAASEERLQQEAQMYADAKQAVETQLLSLERNAHLKFILENPSTSELWELPQVQEIIQRNPTWTVSYIDRCAYGRRSQKPTNILHNTPWIPRGTTGNGMCAAGKCTGRLTPAGKTKHPEQSIPDKHCNTVSRGQKRKGRYEYTRDAAINAIEVPLLEEILTALDL